MNGKNGKQSDYPEIALVPYPVIVAASKGDPDAMKIWICRTFVFTIYDTRMSSPRQKIYNFFCSFSGSFIAAHSCFKWVFTVIPPFRIP